ncbi:hypothetical protein MNB_SV-15-643 [hydrothermal vent metagenome]|uniref:Uncharacterized protein n=1 Tax=hydrothermal vent metagenome TaxID=652676 RepID=A0A1W1EHJ5_9ZZZZ
MKAGLLGVDGTIQTDVNIYSIKEPKYLLNNNWFYGYDITLFNSQSLIKAEDIFNTFFPIDIAHKIRGIDFNIQVGRDIYRENDDSFGVSVVSGVSMPWIDTKMTQKIISNLWDLAQNSETTLYTYKLGVGANLYKKLHQNISVGARGLYAYQTGNIENDFIHSSFEANGVFKEMDISIMAINSQNIDLGIITLPQNIYTTLGYRYKYWRLDDIDMDILGIGIGFSAGDFEMSSDEVYLGVGYKF